LYVFSKSGFELLDHINGINKIMSIIKEREANGSTAFLFLHF